MVDRHLPVPRTDSDVFAMASLEVLDQINARLGDLLDRFPAKASEPEAGTVELREPAAPLTGAAVPEPVTSGPGTAPRPTRTSRKPAATKPAARKRTTVKER